MQYFLPSVMNLLALRHASSTAAAAATATAKQTATETKMYSNAITAKARITPIAANETTNGVRNAFLLHHEVTLSGAFLSQGIFFRGTHHAHAQTSNTPLYW